MDVVCHCFNQDGIEHRVCVFGLLKFVDKKVLPFQTPNINIYMIRINVYSSHTKIYIN